MVSRQGKEAVLALLGPGDFFGEGCLAGQSVRIATRNTHGTGCTFAAAIAAQLALGRPVDDAVRWARSYVEGAIRHAPGLGQGHGPLNHFWRVY